MLSSFWKTAWRNITRHPLFALINVLGLALGVCFCLVIFLVVRYEFSFDRFHPDRDRIYLVGRTIRIGNNLDTFNASRVMPALPAALRSDVTGVEAVTGFFSDWSPSLKVPDPKTKSGFVELVPQETNSWADILLVSPDHFSVFQYQWLAGSPAVLRKPFQVVLSASRARQYFGNVPFAGVMGRRLILDDTLSLYVAGVVADWKERSDLITNVFVSLSTAGITGYKNRFSTDSWGNRRGAADMWTFVRLSPGRDPGRVKGLIQALAKANVPAFEKPEMQLLPLSELHFAGGYSHDPIRKAHKPTLYGVVALAGFILILAVINFVNLSTAQSIRRSREVGVRKVLGGGRMGLTLQFLTETGLVVLFSVVLAALLVVPMLKVFQDFIPEGVRFVPDGSVALFLLAMVLITTLLAGFYPARVLSGYRPVISLRGAAEYKGNASWSLRRGLIVFQFTISLGFIICTLVVGRQVKYLLHSDYGFNMNEVLTVYTSWRDSLSKVTVFQQKLSALPVVAAVTRETGPPVGWGHMFGGWSARPGDSAVVTETNVGDESFVPFYHMRIVAGRNIRHTDSLQEILINETAARSFGFANPEKALGNFLYTSNSDKRIPVPIVGVVADYHTASFHDPIHPVVIGHMPEAETWLGIRLAVTDGAAPARAKAVEAIRTVYNSVYPGQELNYAFMDDTMGSMYADEQKMSMLVRSAMLITIFISCMGLFGVALFSAEKRTREMSIRKVLGASVTQIVTLLCRDFVGLVLLSMGIATPIAWWVMHGWLEGFVYRIPLGVPLFLGAGFCGIGVALLTISFQALRVARANPVKSLNTE